MRKTLSILLVLLLAVSILPTAAFAEGPTVVLSPQNLRVNGAKIACEKYNIDGSNYFKLRDIAMVLSGTGSRFSVGWDGEKKVISVVTGEAYEPNGSELDLSGGDKSATAVPSTQTLLINGEERGDLSAYNIGGNNFFKLRDLGDALGFAVDYDKESNTAIVVSHRWTWPAKWLTEEYIYNEDGAALSHTVITYNIDGEQLSYLYEGPYGSDSYQYTYDELGRPLTQTQDSVYPSDEGDGWEEHSTTTYEYDLWGNLARKVYQATGDVVSETTYTYDDNGNILISETLTNAGSSAIYYTYDENGNKVQVLYTYNDGVTNSEEYEWDTDGNLLIEKFTDSNGEINYSEYTYKDGVLIEETAEYWGTLYSSAYTYDEWGNITRIESQSPDGNTIIERIYDDQGRELQCETNSYTGSEIEVWTYNNEGLEVKYEHTGSDGCYELRETTYNEEGDALSEVFYGDGYTRKTTYTYDRQTKKRTALILVESNEQSEDFNEELVFKDEEVTLAVHDKYHIDYTLSVFYKRGEPEEALIWSSSNENVVIIDNEGSLTAVGPGTAVVTATVHGVTDSCTIVVVPDKYVLSVDRTDVTVGVNTSAKVRCTVMSYGPREKNSIHFGNYDNDIISLQFADEWEENDTIILYIMGLKVGVTTVDIYMGTGESVTFTVTVVAE